MNSDSTANIKSERGGDRVMKIAPSMLLNIVLLTILTTSVFFMNTTANTTKYETASVEYNPWADLNDNGVINIYDVVMVTGIYGSTGVPINKTALLYEVNNTFTELLSRIDGLETQIAELETKLAVLNATKLGKLDYDSGWLTLAKGDNVFPHPLGTKEVIVYIVGKKTLGGAWHQMDYGGFGSTWVGWLGVYWNKLTETEITVHRHGDDENWEYVRIMMWRIPES